MPKLIIDDFPVEVVRKNIKNIHLSVYPPNGRVRIAAPLATDDDTIRTFVISKLSWIKKSQRKFMSQERQAKREFLDREGHYFLGQRYLLKVVEHEAAPKVILKGKKQIELYVRPRTDSSACQKILNEWYRAELKKMIPDIILKWEKKLGLKVNSWSVRQMKTKWGSCNIENKTILLNLELAKKPIGCLEYIIVHEMIHLMERHHNERFLSLMTKFLPRWKSRKEELNQFPISHNEVVSNNLVPKY